MKNSKQNSFCEMHKSPLPSPWPSPVNGRGKYEEFPFPFKEKKYEGYFFPCERGKRKEFLSPFGKEKQEGFPSPSGRGLGEGGFILPMTVLLMVMLVISGMAFLQLDFSERRTSMNERWHQSSFYLSNAAVERARETFKIPDVGTNALTWTDILKGTYDSPDADANPDYPADTTPDSRLCPFTSASNYRGCVIPYFQTHDGNPASIATGQNGKSIVSPDLVFASSFDQGSYTVRAFNNSSETTPCSGTPPAGITADYRCDKDQILTFRAMGTLNGEQKIIEANIKAVSGMNLLNCYGNVGDPCPNNTNGNPTVTPSEGHAPASTPYLPTTDYPLTDTRNYYRSASNFPGYTYIFSTADVTLKNTTKDHWVYFTTKKISIDTGVHLTNIILIAIGGVEIKGGAGAEVKAPLPYPAIISGGDVTKGSGSISIYGNIFATGTIDANPINVHGSMIGNRIEIQGSSTYTDDNNLAYYSLMPGFTYPPEQRKTTVVSGSWREIT